MWDDDDDDVLQLRKNAEENNQEIDRPGIVPKPVGWEATMLPLNDSGGLQIIVS